MKFKNRKILICILIAIGLIYYFEYAVSITWDSAHYISYVNIFERIKPWNEWDIVRGPVFPLIIYVGNIIFGKTTQGLIMNTLVYYIVMLFFTYKILKIFTKETNIQNKKIISIILLLIIINPIIYGYYHALLTEFIAITLASISTYLTFMWLNTNIVNDHKKNMIYNILFILLTIFSWHLKQPYISCSLFPLLTAYIISILENKKINNILKRTGTILLCAICLFISIKTWNGFLKLMGNDPNTDRNPTVFIGNQMINGIDYLKIDNQTSDNYNYTKLSKKEKEEVKALTQNGQEYVIVNIYDNDNYIEDDYIVSNDGQVSFLSSIKYIIKNVFTHPLKLFKSYFFNYLSIIDLSPTTTKDGIEYKQSGKIDLTFSNEITSIAFKPYFNTTNIYSMTDEMHERVQNYEQQNANFVLLNKAMLGMGYICLYIFKLVLLILPIALIYTVIKRCRKNNSQHAKNVYNLLIIIFTFSFLHLLLHTVTGAIIDRYAIPVYIISFIGLIFLNIHEIKQKAK